MADTQQQKIDKFVQTMLNHNNTAGCATLLLPCVMTLLAIMTIVLMHYTYRGDGDKVVDSQVTYTPIVRVFMCTGDRVIFFVKQVNGEIHTETASAEKIVWVTDVAADAPMWAEWQQYYMTKNVGRRTEMTVHIHSVADVGGGGWNSGNRGHGTTTVVE